MRTSGTVIRCALDHGIMHIAARQHLGHRVTHELADTQSALRRAGGRCGR